MSHKLDLLRTGLVTLPGGYDRAGHPLLEFPATSLHLIGPSYTSAQLNALIQLYVHALSRDPTLTSSDLAASLKTPTECGIETNGFNGFGASLPVSGVSSADTVLTSHNAGPPFSALVDLSATSRQTLETLFAALTQAEEGCEGTISCLYAVRPRGKEAQRALQKLVGRAASKGNKKHSAAILPFKVFTVGGASELEEYVPRSQRTEQFGGSLPYSHVAYTTLYERREAVQKSVAGAESRLVLVRERLSRLLREHEDQTATMYGDNGELPASVDTTAMAQQLAVNVAQILGELSVDPVLAQCNSLLKELQEPAQAGARHTTLFRACAHEIARHSRDLTLSRDELVMSWREAERKTNQLLKAEKYKQKAEKVLVWIDEVGLPSVHEEAELADSLSRAELYLHHYTTGLHAIANNVVWLGEKVARKLDEHCGGRDTDSGSDRLQGHLLTFTQHCGRRDTDSGSDRLQGHLLTFTQHFGQRLVAFREMVTRKHNVYSQAVFFHLASLKLQRWFERTLAWWPEELLSTRDQLGHMTQQNRNTWLRQAAGYANAHPPPGDAYLARVRDAGGLFPAAFLNQTQTDVLLSRIETLSSLLSDPVRALTSEDLSCVAQWRQEQSGNSDVTMSVQEKDRHDLSRFEADDTLLPEYDAKLYGALPLGFKNASLMNLSILHDKSAFDSPDFVPQNSGLKMVLSNSNVIQQKETPHSPDSKIQGSTKNKKQHSPVAHAPDRSSQSKRLKLKNSKSMENLTAMLNRDGKSIVEREGARDKSASRKARRKTVTISEHVAIHSARPHTPRSAPTSAHRLKPSLKSTGTVQVINCRASPYTSECDSEAGGTAAAMTKELKAHNHQSSGKHSASRGEATAAQKASKHCAKLQQSPSSRGGAHPILSRSESQTYDGDIEDLEGVESSGECSDSVAESGHLFIGGPQAEMGTDCEGGDEHSMVIIPRLDLSFLQSSTHSGSDDPNSIGVDSSNSTETYAMESNSGFLYRQKSYKVYGENRRRIANTPHPKVYAQHAYLKTENNIRFSNIPAEFNFSNAKNERDVAYPDKKLAGSPINTENITDTVTKEGSVGQGINETVSESDSTNEWHENEVNGKLESSLSPVATNSKPFSAAIPQLTAESLASIMNSNLSNDEKVALMAAMCQAATGVSTNSKSVDPTSVNPTSAHSTSAIPSEKPSPSNPTSGNPSSANPSSANPPSANPASANPSSDNQSSANPSSANTSSPNTLAFKITSANHTSENHMSENSSSANPLSGNSRSTSIESEVSKSTDTALLSKEVGHRNVLSNNKSDAKTRPVSSPLLKPHADYKETLNNTENKMNNDIQGLKTLPISNLVSKTNSETDQKTIIATTNNIDNKTPENALKSTAAEESLPSKQTLSSDSTESFFSSSTTCADSQGTSGDSCKALSSSHSSDKLGGKFERAAAPRKPQRKQKKTQDVDLDTFNNNAEQSINGNVEHMLIQNKNYTVKQSCVKHIESSSNISSNRSISPATESKIRSLVDESINGDTILSGSDNLVPGTDEKPVNNSQFLSVKEPSVTGKLSHNVSSDASDVTPVNSSNVPFTTYNATLSKGKIEPVRNATSDQYNFHPEQTSEAAASKASKSAKFEDRKERSSKSASKKSREERLARRIRRRLGDEEVILLTTGPNSNPDSATTGMKEEMEDGGQAKKREPQIQQHKASTSRDRTRMRKCGIDIEEWIRSQSGLERQNTDSPVMSPGEVTPNTKAGGKDELTALVKEEARTQRDVARTLARAQKILMEEEERIKQETEAKTSQSKSKDANDRGLNAASEDGRALESERHLNSGRGDVNYGAGQPFATESCSTLASPHYEETPRHFLRTTSTDNGSEESGVFTATSQDSPTLPWHQIINSRVVKPSQHSPTFPGPQPINSHPAGSSQHSPIRHGVTMKSHPIREIDNENQPKNKSLSMAPVKPSRRANMQNNFRTQNNLATVSPDVNASAKHTNSSKTSFLPKTESVNEVSEVDTNKTTDWLRKGKLLHKAGSTVPVNAGHESVADSSRMASPKREGPAATRTPSSASLERFKQSMSARISQLTRRLSDPKGEEILHVKQSDCHPVTAKESVKEQPVFNVAHVKEIDTKKDLRKREQLQSSHQAPKIATEKSLVMQSPSETNKQGAEPNDCVSGDAPMWETRKEVHQNSGILNEINERDIVTMKKSFDEGNTIDANLESHKTIHKPKNKTKCQSSKYNLENCISMHEHEQSFDLEAKPTTQHCSKTDTLSHTSLKTHKHKTSADKRSRSHKSHDQTIRNLARTLDQHLFGHKRGDILKENKTITETHNTAQKFPIDTDLRSNFPSNDKIPESNLDSEAEKHSCASDTDDHSIIVTAIADDTDQLDFDAFPIDTQKTSHECSEGNVTHANEYSQETTMISKNESDGTDTLSNAFNDGNMSCVSECSSHTMVDSNTETYFRDILLCTTNSERAIKCAQARARASELRSRYREMTDAERAALDERYERLVGAHLHANSLDAASVSTGNVQSGAGHQRSRSQENPSYNSNKYPDSPLYHSNKGPDTSMPNSSKNQDNHSYSINTALEKTSPKREGSREEDSTTKQAEKANLWLQKVNAKRKSVSEKQYNSGNDAIKLDKQKNDEDSTTSVPASSTVNASLTPLVSSVPPDTAIPGVIPGLNEINLLDSLQKLIASVAPSVPLNFEEGLATMPGLLGVNSVIEDQRNPETSFERSVAPQRAQLSKYVLSDTGHREEIEEGPICQHERTEGDEEILDASLCCHGDNEMEELASSYVVALQQKEQEEEEEARKSHSDNEVNPDEITSKPSQPERQNLEEEITEEVQEAEIVPLRQEMKRGDSSLLEETLEQLAKYTLDQSTLESTGEFKTIEFELEKKEDSENDAVQKQSDTVQGYETSDDLPLGATSDDIAPRAFSFSPYRLALRTPVVPEVVNIKASKPSCRVGSHAGSHTSSHTKSIPVRTDANQLAMLSDPAECKMDDSESETGSNDTSFSSMLGDLEVYTTDSPRLQADFDPRLHEYDANLTEPDTQMFSELEPIAEDTREEEEEVLHLQKSSLAIPASDNEIAIMQIEGGKPETASHSETEDEAGELMVRGLSTQEFEDFMHADEKADPDSNVPKENVYETCVKKEKHDLEVNLDFSNYLRDRSVEQSHDDTLDGIEDNLGHPTDDENIELETYYHSVSKSKSLSVNQSCDETLSYGDRLGNTLISGCQGDEESVTLDDGKTGSEESYSCSFDESEHNVRAKSPQDKRSLLKTKQSNVSKGQFNDKGKRIGVSYSKQQLGNMRKDENKRETYSEGEESDDTPVENGNRTELCGQNEQSYTEGLGEEVTDCSDYSDDDEQRSHYDEEELEPNQDRCNGDPNISTEQKPKQSQNSLANASFEDEIEEDEEHSETTTGSDTGSESSSDVDGLEVYDCDLPAELRDTTEGNCGWSIPSLDLGTPIVLDAGSGLIKCGFANHPQPTVVFPACVGRPKYERALSGDQGLGQCDTYVGQDAQSMRGVLRLSYPLAKGQVNNWDDMEKLWHHALVSELRADLSAHPLLLSEAPMCPPRHRERLIELLFESLGVPAAYLAAQPVLALYGTGRTTGVVFDCGEGVSHVVPVYEGCAMTHATKRLAPTGSQLTQYLVKLVQESGGPTLGGSTAELEIARSIKERLCYVAEDYVDELGRVDRADPTLEAHYTMPDGTQLSIGSERFRCPEALFQPRALGLEDPGIHVSIKDSIWRTSAELHPELLGNIVLSGGSTLFEGLPGRLQRELQSLVGARLSSKVRVHSPAERRVLVWRGGAVLANTDTFAGQWVTRQEYDESGAAIVHRKCF